MHTSSMKRMEWFAENYLKTNKKQNVLDVGSYNVNGCYKEIFNDKQFTYVGLDMEAGPNVDLVPSSTYEWKELSDDQFEVVISGQAFEHIEFFWITMGEMIRVTKEGGLICLIAPNGFAEHRYPVDCWRFFTDGMVALARYYQLEILHVHTNAAPTADNEEWYSGDCADSMLIAKKPYSGNAKKVDIKNYECQPADHKQFNSEMITYEEHLKRLERKNHKNENSTNEISSGRERSPGKINRLIKRIISMVFK